MPAVDGEETASADAQAEEDRGGEEEDAERHEQRPWIVGSQ
jgi:hypothetical protein